MRALAPASPRRSVVLATFLLAALLALALTASARAADTGWQPPVDVSGTTDSVYGGEIAFDAAGNATAIWVAITSEGQVVRTATRPANGDWSAPADLSNRINPDDPEEEGPEPELDVNAAGDATAVWVDRQPNDFAVAIARSRPAGGSWEGGQALSQFTGVSSPEVAVDASGEAVVAFTQVIAKGGGKGGEEESSEARIEAEFGGTGRFFTGRRPISSPGEQAIEPVVGVDGDGNATVAWTQFGLDPVTGKISQTVDAADRPAGGEFGSPLEFSPPGSFSTHAFVAYGPRGDAAITWVAGDENGVAKVSVKPAGGTWGATEDMSPPEAETPEVRFDADGNAIGAWFTYSEVVETADRPVGGKWGQPTAISAAGDESYDEHLAVNGRGDAVLVWSNERSDEFEGIQGATRSAGGTWTAPVDLSSSSLRARQPEVAIDPNGNATALWRGFSAGISSIEAADFVASSTPPGPGPEPEKETTPEPQPRPVDPGVKPTPVPAPTAGTPVTPGVFNLLKVDRERDAGIGALTLAVPGAGTLSVSGAGVESQSVRTTAAGSATLRLMPKGAYRQALAQHRRAFTKVRVAFVGDDGKRLAFDRRVRLVDLGGEG